MGTTPTYGLPWPESSDPPDGPVQIRASMEATDAALVAVRGGPTVPTAWATGVDQASLPGGSANLSLLKWQTWKTLGTPFVTSTATAFRITKTGVYEFRVGVRLRNSVVPAAANNWGQMLSAGALGANLYSRLQPWTAQYCDILLVFNIPLVASAVNVDMNFNVVSSAADAYSITAANGPSMLVIKRLGDLSSVAP